MNCQRRDNFLRNTFLEEEVAVTEKVEAAAVYQRRTTYQYPLGHLQPCYFDQPGKQRTCRSKRVDLHHRRLL